MRRALAGRRRLLSLLAPLALGGVGATLALDAPGVTRGGKSSAKGQSSSGGPGVDAQPGSLSRRRAADSRCACPIRPEGRRGHVAVHTTAGVVCVQLGHVEGGRLGQLGVDGAFNNDGRFHVLAPSASRICPNPASPAHRLHHAGRTFAAEVNGLDRIALSDPPGPTLPSRDRREVSFGLLGPNALSITYRSGGDTRSRPVSPHLGAYLLVQRLTDTPHLSIDADLRRERAGRPFSGGPDGRFDFNPLSLRSNGVRRQRRQPDTPPVSPSGVGANPSAT